MKARINRDSPRHGTWMQIFGSDTVVIIEPPKRNEQGALRILVDTQALNPESLRRVAIKYSRERRIPVDRVLEEIKARGSVPVSAEDVEVIAEETSGSLF